LTKMELWSAFTPCGTAGARSWQPGLVWYLYDVILCTRCEELAQAGHQVWFGNFMTSLHALGARSWPPGLVWVFLQYDVIACNKSEKLATRFGLVFL
jgi:hypothetical protein